MKPCGDLSTRHFLASVYIPHYHCSYMQMPTAIHDISYIVIMEVDMQFMR